MSLDTPPSSLLQATGHPIPIPRCAVRLLLAVSWQTPPGSWPARQTEASTHNTSDSQQRYQDDGADRMQYGQDSGVEDAMVISYWTSTPRIMRVKGARLEGLGQGLGAQKLHCCTGCTRCAVLAMLMGQLHGWFERASQGGGRARLAQPHAVCHPLQDL